MHECLVTIVATPRERFSYTRKSLESILEHTTIPHRLVCVDGGSPRSVRRYLDRRSRERAFEVVRTDRYLSPNQARNLGLGRVRTKYVAFIDNDVVVTPGWLERLVRCAEETGATVVSPLICQGLPLHTEIHCAGGRSAVDEDTEDGKPRRRLIEQIFLQGRKVADEHENMRTGPTGLAEFHCVMARTDFFNRNGPLDERLLSSKEHVDFSIQVERDGGSIYLEPDSVVTFVGPPPLALKDVPYYMLRWSDAWEVASLDRLVEKYQLVNDTYIQQRYKNVGWRRRVTLIRPLCRSLPIGGRRLADRLEKLLIRLDRKLNRRITDGYSSGGKSPAGPRDRSASDAVKATPVAR